MEGINPDLMNQFNFPNIMQNQHNNHINNHTNHETRQNNKEFDPLFHIPPKYDIYGRQVSYL